MNGWMALCEGDERFVFPIEDSREHNIKSVLCWCKPFWDGDVLVHNSADGRENHEKRAN